MPQDASNLIGTKANPEDYLRQVQLTRLFRQLGASNPRVLAETVKHFTVKEAEKRDAIVVDYFGECGINQTVDAITELLFGPPRLPPRGNILDVGAGSGFFTVRIADKVRAKFSGTNFYAMDLTPLMLLSLVKKGAKITPFVGIAENIRGSIEEARSLLKIPYKFDAIFSTLMLHHSEQPDRVFESLKKVLKKNGKAMVVDLCEHGFEEFRTEMGDIHLGFKPEKVARMARKHFTDVKVEKVSGIRCECSGRSTEIFIATLQDSPR